MDAPETVLRARGLGKRYSMRSSSDRRLSRELLRRLAGRGETRDLWAVRGVDLEVRRGECVGVVGANGAGKTTLLSLLAGLIPPSEGVAELRGRVSPFFRIGSGLFGELSVLDNIELAGALFGMDAAARAASLDAVVAFGGLEPYLLARLGELSAGFQARVGLSVALHSAVETVVIDELLAVGDAEFSARCLDRLAVLRAGGTTVVIATHSLGLVTERCTRALHLSGGRVVFDGAPAGAVASYRGGR